MKTLTITIAQKYKIKYEYEDHLKNMIKQIKKYLYHGKSGAGISKNGNIGSFSYKRIGNGKVIK